MTETTAAPGPSRPARRRPFTTWVKKLTHFKGGDGTPKRHLVPKKHASKNNNPYPLSGRLGVINNPNRFDNDSIASSAGASVSYPSHRHVHGHTHRRQGSGSISASISASISGSGGLSTFTPPFASRSAASLERSRRSSLLGSASDDDVDDDGRAPPTAGALSAAPTASTDHDVTRSILAPSHGAASSIAGTSRTINGASSRRGGDSTFSSPAPSVRSLTTTLTTIQSLAPGGPAGPLGGGAVGAGGGSGGLLSVNGPGGLSFSAVPTSHAGGYHGQGHHGQGYHGHHGHHGSQASNGGAQTIHFHQPFPSTPASAIPSHLTPLSSAAGPGHPTTYATATANNLLTDNASILTLASSSKRRRRRSFDTDASVRALAPSSLFGGSRESLPLSVLSANMDGTASVPLVHSASVATSVGGPASLPATPGLAALQHTTSSRMSVASAGPAAAAATAAERSSIYSAAGGAAGDRNSFYARQSLGGGVTGDAASIRSGRSGRSGLLGHGRSESVTGSIGGSLTSPLASPFAGPRDASAADGGAAAPALMASLAEGDVSPAPKTVHDDAGLDAKENDDLMAVTAGK